LNISHYDFDGGSCAIALSNFFENLTCKCSTFTNIDNMLSKLNYDEWDAVILTDCNPKDKSLLKVSPKLIMLDHHPEDESNGDIIDGNLITVVDNCAAVLTKNWLEATFDIDLSHLNTFLTYTDDYDRWIHNHKKSKMINELFWLYGYYDFIKRFVSGNCRFTKTEIAHIRKKMKDFENLYFNLEVFELSRLNACFTFCTEFMNDVADRLIYKDGYDFVFIQNAKSKHVSIRVNKNVDIHIGHLLKKLDCGGGHPKAGGLATTYSDISKLEKEIFKIESAILEHVSEKI